MSEPKVGVPLTQHLLHGIRAAVDVGRVVRGGVLDGVKSVVVAGRVVGDQMKTVSNIITDPLKDVAEAAARLAERRLRERFGGKDDSLSSENVRKRKLERYRLLFHALGSTVRGGVPVNDLEEAFGLAGLPVARTEVGRLSYQEDLDGNGVLDFDEFTSVMDRLASYHERRNGSFLKGKIEGSFLYGTEGASMSAQKIAWETLTNPGFSRFARVVSVLLSLAIIIAVGCFVLSSSVPIDREYHATFFTLEAICVFVFSVEYVAKLLCAQPTLARYLVSGEHLMEALTLLPFLVDLIEEERVVYSSANGLTPSQQSPISSFLRIFRTLRLLKLTRYVPYVSLMTASAAASAAPMAMAGFVLLIGSLLLAFGAYFSERGVWSDAATGYVLSDGNLSPFQSIGESLYWAIITLTTVGYGDIVPSTALGLLVGAITAVAGTIIVAFPVSIYAEEFAHEYEELEKTNSLQAEMAAALEGDKRSDEFSKLGREPHLVDRLLAAQTTAIRSKNVKMCKNTGTLFKNLSPAVPLNLALIRNGYAQSLSEATTRALENNGGPQSPSAVRSSNVGRGIINSPSEAMPIEYTDASREKWTLPAGGVPLSTPLYPESHDPFKFVEVWGLLTAASQTSVDLRDPAFAAWGLGEREAEYDWYRSESQLETEAHKAANDRVLSASRLGRDRVHSAEEDSGEDLYRAVAARRKELSLEAARTMGALGRSPSEGYREAQASLLSIAAEASRLTGIVGDQILDDDIESGNARLPLVATTVVGSDDDDVERSGIYATASSTTRNPAPCNVDSSGVGLDARAVEVPALNFGLFSTPPKKRPSDTLFEGSSGTHDLKNITGVTGEGGGGDSAEGVAQGVGFDVDSHRLTPASFESYDLTQDKPLCDAILALLTDKRKHVWAAIRLLESRFRDDLSIEISRRWVRWMGMPPDYVGEVSR